jgi:hypothetical protein
MLLRTSFINSFSINNLTILSNKLPFEKSDHRLANMPPPLTLDLPTATKDSNDSSTDGNKKKKKTKKTMREKIWDCNRSRRKAMFIMKYGPQAGKFNPT